MSRKPSQQFLAAVISVCCALIWGTGCASQPASTQRLRPSDFASGDTTVTSSSGGWVNDSRDDEDPPTRPEPGPQPFSPERATQPVMITGPLAASEGLEVVASPGPPVAIGQEAPQPIGESVFVDARIGDVNGKAIYASQFLAPMSARLRALSREKGMTLEKWREQAAAEISRQLDDIVVTELLRAEALSSFTPERKAGFFAFMESLQRSQRSLNMGSESLTRKRLQEREGMTEAQWRKTEEAKQLVSSEYYKIRSRVHISPRDSKLYYERNIDKFVPPATARFRRISVSTSDTQSVERIQSRLAADEPFIEVAMDDANGFRFQGGLVERTFRGERSEARFFETPSLNDAARSLEPGEWVGPMEVRGDSNWLYLESLDQTRIEWYEAQVKIDDELFQQGFMRERDKYIQRLAGRATITPKREMGERLLAIAQERYYKPLDE